VRLEALAHFEAFIVACIRRMRCRAEAKTVCGCLPSLRGASHPSASLQPMVGISWAGPRQQAGTERGGHERAPPSELGVRVARDVG
jgi:hypothetical protein